jgi:hypothetical protein
MQRWVQQLVKHKFVGLKFVQTITF